MSLHRQTADGFMFPPQLFEQSEWQPTNVDGKGYLLNEPGAQPSSVYGDFSCKEEPEIDSPGGKRSPGLYGFWRSLWRLGNAWGQSQIKAPFKTGPAGIAASRCCRAEDELCLLLALHNCVRFLIPFLIQLLFCFVFCHLLGDIGMGLPRSFTNVDSIWMDNINMLPSTVRLPPIQAISCAP